MHLHEKTYTDRIEQYCLLHQKVCTRSKQIGTLRLLIAGIALFSLYIYTQFDSVYGGIGILLSSMCFLLLIKIHTRIKEQTKIYQELIDINKREGAYVKGIFNNFETGEEFVETEHAYTYDLDIFGQGSLFQSINRTCTAIGKIKLAELFRHSDQHNILPHQKAVEELSHKIDWRQHFTAKGNLTPDSSESIHNTKEWVASVSYFRKHTFYSILSYLSPLLLLSLGTCYFIFDKELFYNLCITLSLIHLALFGVLLKHIKKDYEHLSNSAKQLFLYSQLIADIENESFQSNQLLSLQKTLLTSSGKSSEALKALSSILFRLDSIHYGIPTVIFNGLFLYHLHAIYALDKWKQRYGNHLVDWLNVIREIDSLNSLGNFAYNNPSFVYPSISTNDELVAENMGHPLIPSEKRVGNNVSFDQQKFIVLTGSNMSGKSTFLRTVGLNLILAKMGSPVCATRFVFYPYDVFLSMRINDSLQNNESFFFAELKRLKHLIDLLSTKQRTFILLDEILRGTNSNDKYAGTIGLVEKLIAKKAVGMIATHDLSVTKLTDKHPDYLLNKCFEVEIKDDELYFDYRLKEGVCEKMSASFLMEKMGII